MVSRFLQRTDSLSGHKLPSEVCRAVVGPGEGEPPGQTAGQSVQGRSGCEGLWPQTLSPQRGAPRGPSRCPSQLTTTRPSSSISSLLL